MGSLQICVTCAQRRWSPAAPSAVKPLCAPCSSFSDLLMQHRAHWRRAGRESTLCTLVGVGRPETKKKVRNSLTLMAWFGRTPDTGPTVEGILMVSKYVASCTAGRSVISFVSSGFRCLAAACCSTPISGLSLCVLLPRRIHDSPSELRRCN